MRIVYLIDKKKDSINIQLNKSVLCQMWLFLTSSLSKCTHAPFKCPSETFGIR